MAHIIGHLGDAVRAIVGDTGGKAFTNARRAKRGIELNPALTRQIRLNPPVIPRLIDQHRDRRRIGNRFAWRHMADHALRRREHRQNQLVNALVIQRTVAIPGRRTTGAQQRNQQTRLIQRIARLTPERAAGPA